MLASLDQGRLGKSIEIGGYIDIGNEANLPDVYFSLPASWHRK
jgi:hypothetical protein